MINFLDTSLKKRGIINENLKEQVSDEEDQNDIVNFQTEEEDRVHTALADVLVSLFKTHPDHCLDVVNYLYT